MPKIAWDWVSGGLTVLGMVRVTVCVVPLSQGGSFEFRNVTFKIVPSCSFTSAAWVLPFLPPPASSSPVLITNWILG
jgi:hypothetical protein